MYETVCEYMHLNTQAELFEHMLFMCVHSVCERDVIIYEHVF
jgi:hypothetical protein